MSWSSAWARDVFVQNAVAAAAVKAAAELMDTADKPQSVLRIVIDNMIYPITLEVIHKVKCWRQSQ